MDELSLAGLLIGDKIKLLFEIGNHYQELSKSNKNRNGTVCNNYWTAFVRLKDQIPGLKIDKVVKHVFFKLC